MDSKKIELLPGYQLFDGLDQAELVSFCECLEASEREYEKGEPILHAGQSHDRIGVLLSGGINIVSNDFWGNRTIIEKLGPGRTFAETIAFSGVSRLPFSVIASESSSVLFIKSARLMTPCRKNCGSHNRIIRNMLTALADKNIMFAQKIEIISRRTTREKLLAYLSAESGKTGNASFSIPLNRQELADYLCVDRSAMSAELGRLRDEGILSFKKNSFELFKAQQEN